MAEKSLSWPCFSTMDNDMIAAFNNRLMYGHDQPQNQRREITVSNNQVMGHRGHSLPIAFPTQTSTRQNTGLVQGFEFHPENLSKPPLQQTQPIRNVGQISQNRVNGSIAYAQWCMRQGQTRHQMPQQAPAPEGLQFNLQPPLSESEIETECEIIKKSIVSPEEAKAKELQLYLPRTETLVPGLPGDISQTTSYIEKGLRTIVVNVTMSLYKLGCHMQTRQNPELGQGSEFHPRNSSRGPPMQGMQATRVVGRFPQTSENGSAVYALRTMRQCQTRQQRPQQAPVQIDLQSPFSTSTRQNTVLVQGSEFQSWSSSEPPVQGMQATGMLGCFSQDCMNESIMYTQTRMRQQGQTRQRMPQQTSLTSAQAQRQQRASYINSQLYNLAQNEESSMTQSPWSLQQRIEQTHTIVPNSPIPGVQKQRWQQIPRQHRLASPSQSVQTSIMLNDEALMTQSPLLHQQWIENVHTISPNSPIYGVRRLRQQQTPLRTVPGGEKSLNFVGSRGVTETSNHLLGKRKIQDLVSQVDKHGKLDPEVEDLLLEIADNFIDSVATFACRLAKHRKSSTLEAKDVLLHLEKNWGLTIPGYSSKEKGYQFRPTSDLVSVTYTSQMQQQIGTQ